MDHFSNDLFCFGARASGHVDELGLSKIKTISHQANIVSSVLQDAFEALIDNSTRSGEMLYLRHDVIRRRDSSCKGDDGDGNDNCTEDLRAQIFIFARGGWMLLTMFVGVWWSFSRKLAPIVY